MRIISLFKELLWPAGGCLFRRLTGLYCPGCGGTRAVIAFIHGRFILSARYNPAVVCAAGLLLFALVRYLLGRARKKPVKSLLLPEALVFLFVLLANFAIKDIALAAFGVDLMPDAL